jgi:tRNA (guanine-N7-)-methyltransferase
VETAIYKPTNWLDPLQWGDVFTVGHAPVEIDVGCGKGGFLLWAAQARPDTNFVGLERQLVRVRKVDKKVGRLRLTNVRLIRVEVAYFIGKLVPDHSVRAYHIYFPDPWPKRRHQPRRLFQPAFVDDLDRTLSRGGEVNVATDDADYFEQIRKVMVGTGRFEECAPAVLPVEARTEFELVFLKAGKPICRSRFVRRDHSPKSF